MVITLNGSLSLKWQWNAMSSTDYQLVLCQIWGLMDGEPYADLHLVATIKTRWRLGIIEYNDSGDSNILKFVRNWSGTCNAIAQKT